MDGKQLMLRHFLAALAYRTQKAVREAPPEFGEFRPSPDVRCPKELVRHMTSVLGYARTFFIGGSFQPEPMPTLESELARFHEMLARLGEHFTAGDFSRMTPERLLQGPLSDAMTHTGQLALLRRLFGAPVPPENYILADIQSGNVSTQQSEPIAPDKDWHTPAGPQEPR